MTSLEASLFALLESGESYSLEALSERLGVSRGEIHRAFTRLRVLPGWSIHSHNQTPYGRQVVDGRKRRLPLYRRPKGTPYEHDPHEPDWQRTLYLVRRPIA